MRNGVERRVVGCRAALAVVLILASASAACGQESDSTNEFWPEIDLFIKLREKSRLFVVYSGTRQENLGAYADGQVGVYFDYWALPALGRTGRANADVSRSKLLFVRAGYLFSRPLNSSGAVTEHMLTYELTGRANLPASLLLSDRNRVDLRWVDGDFKWRYRNRLKLERTFAMGHFELTPYAHGEVFYSIDQGAWTRVRYAAGAEWSITRRIVLEGYFLRQNDWKIVPQFVNAIGMAVQLYFR
jgi:hypothetical protein